MVAFGLTGLTGLVEDFGDVGTFFDVETAGLVLLLPGAICDPHPAISTTPTTAAGRATLHELYPRRVPVGCI